MNGNGSKRYRHCLNCGRLVLLEHKYFLCPKCRKFATDFEPVIGRYESHADEVVKALRLQVER